LIDLIEVATTAFQLPGVVYSDIHQII